MSCIAVCSLKGGVGKTSAAVNLAALAAREGPTLLIDLDTQGSATYALGVTTRVPGGAVRLLTEGARARDVAVPCAVPGLSVVPADFSLRRLDGQLAEVDRPRRRLRRTIQRLGEGYDRVVLDCPPGIALSIEGVLRAADLILVPIEPATLPMHSIDQLQAYLAADKRLRRAPLRGFVSRVDRRRGEHRRLADELLASQEEIIGLIPNDVAIERMSESRSPLVMSAPRSRGALAYAELWSAVKKALD